MLYFKHYVFEFCAYVYFSFKHFRLHLIRVFVLDVCKSRSLGTDRKKAKCPWWMKILVLFSTDVQKMKISSWFMVYCRDDNLCYIFSCLSSNFACQQPLVQFQRNSSLLPNIKKNRRTFIHLLSTTLVLKVLSESERNKNKLLTLITF